MDDKEYKKLNRKLGITCLLLLVVLLINLFTIVFFYGAVHNSVAGAPGKIGSVGEQGIQGPVGPAGAPGAITYVSIPSIPTTVTPAPPVIIPGPKGDAGNQGIAGTDGKDGKPGEPGREQQLQFNSQTGSLEARYSGDELWDTVIPCDILKTCPQVQ